jgi:hypothetical protein
MNVLHAGMQKSERQNITEVLSHHNSEVLLLRGVVVDTVTRATWCYEQPEKVYTRAKLKGRLQAWLPECDHTFILQIASLSMINQRDGIALKVNTLETLLSHYVHLLGYQGSFFGQFRSGHRQHYPAHLKGCAALITKTTYSGIVLGKPKVGDLVFVAYGSRYPLSYAERMQLKSPMP